MQDKIIEFEKRDLDGYIAYDVYTPVNKEYGIAILDIKEAPGHVHRIGVEHFIVLEGSLHITLNDRVHILNAGQYIHIPIETKHILKSANTAIVRVLCVNFPAFNPDDMIKI